MAVIAVSAMLLIALSISDVAFKEQVITYAGRDSKTSSYAAVTGVECALYHDIALQGIFSFPTVTPDDPGPLHCANTSAPSSARSSGGKIITTFYFNLTDNSNNLKPSCAIVEVTKEVVDPNDPDNPNDDQVVTLIESRGYNNTCSEDGPSDDPQLSDYSTRNLERAYLMRY